MKISIADPQARVCFGLRILLEQQPGWTVIGEAADCQELLALLQNCCPDLVLIDCDLPGAPAGTLLRKLRIQYPDLLVISMSGKQELRQACLKAGADGFTSKMEPPEKLLNLIRLLSTGKEQSPCS